jgi:hypothetical protein
MHTRGVRPREGSLTRVDGTSINSQDPRVLLDIALSADTGCPKNVLHQEF